MKTLQKLLVCFVFILFIFGCGTTIKTVITSDPPGALVYSGDTADNMSYEGTTPMTLKFLDEKPYWKQWYYQIRKPGYEDSKLIIKPQGEIGADRYVHAKLKPSGESDTNAEQKTVAEATEIEKTEQKIKPLKSETKVDDEKLKSVVYIKIPSYIYTKPNFEGRELTFLDKGTKLTVIDTKENWIKVQSQYGEGWIQTNRVVADASGFEKAEEKIKPPKSETKVDDENPICAEIYRLSDELLSLMSKLNFDKHNKISLKILSLIEDLHIAGSEKQIPDCDSAVHLAFSRKATVSFSGKGMIDREDARIKYKMAAKGPAILQIDFVVFPTSNLVMSYGIYFMSEGSCSSNVEFNGVLRDSELLPDGGTREKWVNATQFEWRECPDVTMAGVKAVIEPYSSIPYTATVEPPKVTFYSNKRPLPSYPSAYPFDFQWSPIRLSIQDLQKAFETGRLTLRRKTEKKSLSGTVTIDFAPPDPELQASGPSNPEGVGLWGDRTTHGGFLLATEKDVFSDEHPIAKEGDPVLCPIHGLSKVSRDESSGVYIGDKTVAFEGGKADCGAKILSGSTLTEVQLSKQ
jgi:uncharacterized Zn-binding protein involved in type VI secretion